MCNVTSIAEGGVIDYFALQFHPGNPTYDSCPANPVPFTFPIGTQPGYVNVDVDVTNSDGCGAHTTYDSVIHLIPNPIANFTQDTANAECAGAPLIVCFTADSADPHITYCWYVNGVQKKCSNTSRVFCDTFPVCNCCYDIGLTVHHPSGCSDSLVKHNDVCVSSKPIISWTPMSDSICLPAAPVTFTNTSPNIGNLTWSLSGGVPPATFPTVTAPTATYNIVNPGVYTLIASGTFAPGCVRVDTAIVIHAFNTPVSAFTVSDSFSCSVPDTVTFTAAPCAGCTYLWTGNGGGTNTAISTGIYAGYNSYPVTLTTQYQYGTLTCSSQATKLSAVVVKNVNPQISSTGYKGCLPECVTLKNATVLTGFPPSVTITSACWSFPGSSLVGGCQDTLQRCLDSVGCNSVELTITTNIGCSQSVILVDTLCGDTAPNNCSLTASPLSMCFEQDTVKFTITCSDSFGWVNINFGDAGANSWTTFYQNSFTHIYQDTGAFIAMAVVYNDSCSSDTLRSDTIRVFPPIAKFADSLSCASKDTIYFTNQSIGATSYSWTFCHGDTSTLARPYIVAPYCDTCSATLTVFNSRTGCSHHKYLAFNTPCDSTSFSPMDTSICVNASVIFRNTSVPAPSFTEWDFNWPTAPFTITGPVQANAYTSPGVYTVAMQTTTASGCSDTLFGTVHVCNISANFIFDTVCFPAPICFHDTTTSLCTPTVWRWNFGDGTTDSVQNPCHVYQNPGSVHRKTGHV